MFVWVAEWGGGGARGLIHLSRHVNVALFTYKGNTQYTFGLFSMFLFFNFFYSYWSMISWVASLHPSFKTAPVLAANRHILAIYRHIDVAAAKVLWQQLAEFNLASLWALGHFDLDTGLHQIPVSSSLYTLIVYNFRTSTDIYIMNKSFIRT